MLQLAAVYVHLAHLGAAVQLGEDLAGIEQKVGVEAALDALHGVQVVLAELFTCARSVFRRGQMPQIHVVLSWFEELTRLVPVN